MKMAICDVIEIFLLLITSHKTHKFTI